MFTGPKGDVEGEEKGRRGGRLLDVEMRRDEMTEERSHWKLLLAKGMIRFEELVVIKEDTRLRQVYTRARIANRLPRTTGS